MNDDNLGGKDEQEYTLIVPGGGFGNRVREIDVRDDSDNVANDCRWKFSNLLFIPSRPSGLVCDTALWLGIASIGGHLFQYCYLNVDFALFLMGSVIFLGMPVLVLFMFILFGDGLFKLVIIWRILLLLMGFLMSHGSFWEEPL